MTQRPRKADELLGRAQEMAASLKSDHEGEAETVISQLIDEVMRLRTALDGLIDRSGEQGNRILRQRIGFDIARAWGFKADGWDGEVACMLRDWSFDGTTPPIPWPRSPFVTQWLETRGYQNVHGHVGYRLTGTMVVPDETP